MPNPVTFSDTSEMVFVSNRPEDRAAAWYSQDDHDRFELEAIRDARRMARLLGSIPATALPEVEDELNVIGIEMLLSSDLLRHLAVRRREHLRAILVGQRHCNERQLALLSERSSEWSREGAVNRANALREGFSALFAAPGPNETAGG